jgi:flagellar biosynthesis GTPase FlhF
MKRLFIFVSAAVLVAAFSAFKVIESQTIQALERIGIPADIVKSSIWNSISGGYLSYPSIAKLKQVAVGDRAGIVREIATFAKSYSKTEEFKKQYLEYRESKKPEAPEKPKTMAEQRAAQKAELQKGLKESEENMKKAPADQKEIFKGIITMFKDQLKQTDDPKNPMYSKDMDVMMQQAFEQQMVEHKKQVAEWEKEWPTNPTPMIRKWLTEFLEVSKGVEFGAALKAGEYGKMVFVKSEYEAKPSNWKMCYRAGKDVVDAGRTAAQQWLSELK